LTSSSSTSTRCGSWPAARSVIRFVRPKPVSSTSAPSSCARAAVANAIEHWGRHAWHTGKSGDGKSADRRQ